MAMETSLKAASEDAGTRLDVFLAARLADTTRSAAARLLAEGCVRLGGRPCRKNYRLTGGETFAVTLPEPKPMAARPQDLPLRVVYEDADVIVIDKPKNMVVHPAAGNPDGTVVNALLAHCGGSLSGIGGTLRPGFVHRFDKDTSGLLIAAKYDFAHRALSAQLRDHTLARTYEAVVVGALPEDAGTVDAPIGRSPKNRKKMAVVADGRPARTHWEVLGRYPGYTHVRCRLETGRTHQIRVHMAWLGHPVAGDTVYGGGARGLHGQCLHARELTIVHPRTGERMTLSCELPEEFTAFLRQIGADHGEV